MFESSIDVTNIKVASSRVRGAHTVDLLIISNLSNGPGIYDMLNMLYLF